MAKILFGALMVDMRGKQGGTVYSRNRGGAYSKNKVTPLNPSTSLQGQQRADLSFQSQAWRELTDEQRSSWNSMAIDFPYIDVFGNSRTLSGQQLFLKLNLNLTKALASTLVVPVAPQGVQADGVMTVAVDATAVDITLNTVMASNSVLVIRATPCISAGIKNFKSRLRQLAIADTGAGTAIDLIAEFTAKYGVPVAGSRVGFSFQVINTNTGQASAWNYFDAIVA